jgi:putative transposase
MAVTTMELKELLRKADGAEVDFLREGVRVLAQALMDAEVSAQVGAEHSQRSPERTTHRNGYRARDWDTRVGTIDLQIPRVRAGSYLPSFLEPRRRAERALAAVVAQCSVEGVSTRRVEDIAQAMGITSLSKSQVSRVCAELDELVATWRNRPLDAGPYVFVWLDALSVKVREAGRVVNTAALVATGVNAAGHREILGLELGAAEDGPAGPGSCAAWSPAALPGSSWSSATPTKAWSTPSPACWRARAGSAAGPISCATCWSGSPGTPSQWWPAWSAPASPAAPRGRLGPARPRRRAVTCWPLR